MAPVGERRTEIGDLQRRKVHLALSDGDGDDRQRIPRLEGMVVELRIRNHPALLTGKVDAQLVSESHGHHVVAPDIHGIVERPVLAAVGEHVVKSPAEEAVAGSTDGGDQRERGRMTVAAYVQSLEIETVVTGIPGRIGDDSLRIIRDGLTGLECRPRGILSHDGTVEQRFRRVKRKVVLVLSAQLADHRPGIEGRRRHHRQNLSCLRLDRHDGAELALHQPFAECLEIGIKAELQVASGVRPLVVLAVLVTSLYLAVGVAKQDLHALASAQVLFVFTLDAHLSDIVARLVVVVFLDVALAHLRHVAEHVCGDRTLILADAAFLYVEAGEAVELLLKGTELLVAQLAQEELLGKAGIAGVLVPVLDAEHPVDEVGLGDIQSLAELKRIEVAGHLIGDDHDVVGRLVVDQQPALPVRDRTARGELDLLQKGIRVGALPIVVAGYLKCKKTYDIDRHDADGDRTEHKAAILKIVIFHILPPPYVLDYKNKNKCEQRTAADALQPFQHVEEAEHLQREEGHIVYQDENGGIPRVLWDAERVHAGLEIFAAVTRDKRTQHEGLQSRRQCQRPGGDSRRVRESVNDDAHQKAPQQDRPLGIVAREKKDEIDIKQRRGDSKQMDVVENKHLCHRQDGKP